MKALNTKIAKAHRLAAVALCLVILGIQGPQAAPGRATPALPLRAESRPAAELRHCGIGLSTAELLTFLDRGVANTAALPDEPREKCQLVIDAMSRLAETRAKEAGPVLLRVASVDLPAGVLQMLEHDVRNTAPEGREDFKNRALRLLQYNAINALGLIGDKSSVPIIRSVFQAETNTGARIQYAICLASLGDTSGVDYLVTVIQRQNRRESAAAAKAFTIITGQNFGYSDNTPLRARKTRATMYAQWWRTNQREFRVDPVALAQRRLDPDSSTTYQPRNTRDLLKLASNYFDFDNASKSWEARKSLKDAGTGINADLERIAQDPNEDLNVRMEAMNWYFEANHADAKALMKRLKRDENPEIEDKANTLLEQIEEDLHPPAAQQMQR